MNLIDALRRPECYPHEVELPILLRETHISWILLTGRYAYKIKKPVDFGFLDFTTLEKRRFFCFEEFRLNRRLAAHLYLDVVPITGTPEHPKVGGEGEPLEYAVKMVQFNEEALLARRAMQGLLGEREIDLLADKIARFHQEIPRVKVTDPYGTPKVIQQAVLQNFDQIAGRSYGERIPERLHHLRQWSEQQFQRLAPMMQKRREEGFVREGHGDLHLGNIILWQGEPLPFDALEFNPSLRWIDVLSETAFTTMDLAARGYKPLGFRFLNRYLWTTGDYGDLALLPYYLTYRAIVRAKIAHLTDPKDRDGFFRYFRWAEHFSRPKRPFLLLTYGVSGSGKSSLARKLAGELEAVHLRSDVERKRLAGLHWQEPSKSALGHGLYTPEMTSRTYGRLAQLAEEILKGGLSVIVDATFLKRAQRAPFVALAKRLGLPVVILVCWADRPLLKERVLQRLEAERDASEATLAVLEAQLKTQEPPSPGEADLVLEIDTGQTIDLQTLTRKIQAATERSSPPGSNLSPA